MKAPRKQKGFTFAIYVKRTSTHYKNYQITRPLTWRQNLNVQYVVEFKNPRNHLRTT